MMLTWSFVGKAEVNEAFTDTLVVDEYSWLDVCTVNRAR